MILPSMWHSYEIICPSEVDPTDKLQTWQRWRTTTLVLHLTLRRPIAGGLERHPVFIPKGLYLMECEASFEDVCAHISLEINSFQRDCGIVKFKTHRLFEELRKGFWEDFKEPFWRKKKMGVSLNQENTSCSSLKGKMKDRSRKKRLMGCQEQR